MLRKVEIVNRSGFEISTRGDVKPLRKGYYVVRPDLSVGGDAPKDFIQVYRYGEGRRATPRSWPSFIAKVGHKWYPMESVTEELLSRIGLAFGLTMASSRLVWAGDQLRFLSKYFLGKDESLVHGAELFAGYLEDENLSFVHEVEQEKMSQELFTFQFIAASITWRFPEHGPSIMREFVRMLGFDAIVGNKDRHFYNWGVIRNDLRLKEPRFSPIFDTARALFWNEREERLVEKARVASERTRFLENYIKGSKPKIGWEGFRSVTHFELMSHIWGHYEEFREVLEDLYRPEALEEVRLTLNVGMCKLMSVERRSLILECLERRLQLFRESLA